MDNFDVIVVGNGILGLTLSYFLKKKNPNLTVALIGKNTREGCATLAAGAMLNLWAEIGNNQFENHALAERFKLTKQGVDSWEQFAKELSEQSNETIEVKWGTYVLRTLRSTQIEDNAFKYIKSSLKKFEIDHKELLAEDIPWVKPSQCSRLIEALWVPDGFVDSRKVIKSLDEIMKRVGVHVFNNNATQLTLDSNKQSPDHHIILDNQTRLKGKNVVLANGAFAQTLIDQNESIRSSMPRLLFGIGAGIDITVPNWIYTYGGLGKEILDLKEVIRTTDRGGACGVHVVPYGNGQFYAGASSLTSLDPDPEPKLHGVHNLVHALIYEINRGFFHTGIRLRGNGFRPTSADCFPMIGETHQKGIWLLNGTKRDGFSMSAHISKELANAILGETTTLPSLFQPCRSLISYKTKEEAIKDAELMFIGADYQHGGLQVPYMVDRYNQMRSQDIQNIYNKRNIKSFGIHPELIHLYENDTFYSQIKHKMDQYKSESTASELISFIKRKVGALR